VLAYMYNICFCIHTHIAHAHAQHGPTHQHLNILKGLITHPERERERARERERKREKERERERSSDRESISLSLSKGEY